MSAPISAHSVVAILHPGRIVLTVTRANITLDENHAPYAEAELECELPDTLDRSLVDLRTAALTLEIRLRQDFGTAWRVADVTADVGGSVAATTALLDGDSIGSLTNRYYQPWNDGGLTSKSRTLTLLVGERVFNDTSSTLSLIATSSEARLINDALIATEPFDPGTTSLQRICARVLERYGEKLHFSSLDATVAEIASTIWQPGIGAWEYLNPMLETASLRLWCDEVGDWRISARQSSTSGSVTIRPSNNMTGHVDRMTFDPAVWYDAVVVEYRWVDSAGVSRVAYDVAGASPPRAVRREERPNTRYPGPGAAAGLLGRARGRGRVLDVTALSNSAVTPGMSGTITPPQGDVLTGAVSAVTWRFPDDEMDVVTRGLVDTPTTSWLFTPLSRRWNDVPPATSWQTYTP